MALHWRPDQVELTVEDDGAGRSPTRDSGGFGLAGMKERAQLIGGRVGAGEYGEGWRVRLVVPLRPTDLMVQP